HLGVLSTVYRDAAWNVFDKDCLVRLGTVIAPRGTASQGAQVMTVKMEMPDGATIEESVGFGEIKRIPLSEGKEVDAVIEPARGFDVGKEPGHRVTAKIMGGVSGVILDGRGRPLQLPSDDDERRALIREWFAALGMYPEEMIKKLF
ncbi:MAG: methylaspartate mutase, partial [Candidatus Bathyarchaeota archaeon]|nr:methylaspartate mutase [Candidatus Bathyarchaeota archaeon]